MDFLESLRESFAMWEHPMESICEKAGLQRVKNVMYTPTEHEHVEADATLDMAVHQLVVGSHQSLLVVDEGRIIGILRLVDVFLAVADAIKNCVEEQEGG
jgi:predicted transcriptional regulator